MTKLSDTQLLILSAAAQRDGNIALPLPPSLRGGAAQKVVGALLGKGYLAEVEAGREAGDLVWRAGEDGRGTTLVATPAGLEAIGIEPEGEPAAAGESAPADDTATAGATAAPKGKGGRKPRDRRKGAPAAPRAKDGARTPTPRTGTKQAALIDMLRAPEGASIEEIVAATGWQPHTVRGAIAGALKKKLGLDVTSEKDEKRGRVYRLSAEA